MTRRDAVRYVPPAHPDEGFLFADDATRLTWREIAKIGLGTLIGAAAMYAALVLILLASAVGQ